MAPRLKPYSELGEAYQVTDGQRAFMHRRVGGLLGWSELAQRPLLDLLANAYAFGLADAAEVIGRRAKPTTASREGDA